MNEYYARLKQKNAAPLWEILDNLFSPEPQTPCLPALWKYSEIRPLLLEAGTVITPEQATRRVLILENPGLNVPQITQSLYAGLQLILPGEIAPSHRHMASALRFVLESKGAYTAVDGARTVMEPGDFVLTPSWTFHDHGNDGDAPAIWIDGLDHIMVNFFDTGFIEKYPEPRQPITRRENEGSIFNYRYSKYRETLETMSRNGAPDPRHGIKMEYRNPATGGYPMPTIAAFLQLLPAGFRGGPYRSTDGTIFCCTEGRGKSRIGGSVFEWEKHDIFVVPSWIPVAHEADVDAVLFSFSDRPAQQALGFWREQEL